MKGKCDIQPFCTKCEIIEMKLETITKKLEKSKLKLKVQRRINMKLKMVLVLYCLIIALLYNLM